MIIQTSETTLIVEDLYDHPPTPMFWYTMPETIHPLPELQPNVEDQ